MDGMKYVLPLISAMIVAFALFKPVAAVILGNMGIDSQVMACVVSANLTGCVLLITLKIWQIISDNKNKKEK